MNTQTVKEWLTSMPTGCYVDGCQYTLAEGNLLVLGIARDFGYSGVDVDESIDWLNENCRDENAYPLAWWGWFESMFGLWDIQDL